MRCRAWVLGVGLVACARVRPPDVIVVVRHEQLSHGPRDVAWVGLRWPIDRARPTYKEEEKW